MKLRTLLLLVTFIISKTSAFAEVYELKKEDYLGFPDSLNGKDFFVKRDFKKIKKKLMVQNEDCRQKISEVICVVNPSNDDDPFSRPCLPESKSYAFHFEKIYDYYPNALQKMFCSIDRLFIEKSLRSIAYAGSSADREGNLTGSVIGIRKSAIDEKLKLATIISWKEQLSFGGIVDSYTITPDLPQITTNNLLGDEINDLLYFIIAHEFGHLFDFANNVTDSYNCNTSPNENETPECDVRGDFALISWLTTTKAKPKDDFKNRASLCFYFCDGRTIKKEDISDLYADFYKSQFINLYSATNPYDDFAESVAFYVADKYLNLNFKVNTLQGNLYDLMVKLHSGTFKEKYDYVEHFLNRADIKYP